LNPNFVRHPLQFC